MKSQGLKTVSPNFQWGHHVYGITNAMAQHIGLFSFLEIIGKLISQFKGRHTTVSKRSILGVIT